MRITTRPRAVTAAVSAVAVAASVSAVMSATPSWAASPAAVPGDLTLVATKQSLLGSHQWYRQTYQGLPVVGGYYARHLDRAGQVDSIVDGRKKVAGDRSVKPSVGKAAAVAKAVDAVTERAARTRAGEKNTGYTPAADTSSASLALLGGATPRLVWQVVTRSAEGSAKSLVDARSGQTLSVRTLSRAATGTGRVFDPSPVVTLKDGSLQDQRDANQAVFLPAYSNVSLRNLDGSGTLSGRYVRITKAVGGLAKTDTNTFVYERASHEFEQVMSYYHTNQTQEYIQSLGFTDVNNEAQKINVNTYGGDNSFYDPSNDTMTFGRGGVDDGEDAEVIWHEYGHAIQDAQVPGYGESPEAGAIGEGFGDYWAVTMSVPVSDGFDLPCVADWDSVSYTSTEPHCLRRTDTGKTTDDKTGEVHDDGEIWSHALWDIHRTLGRERADKVILESQFSYAPDTSFADAARNVVTAARQLYGNGAANACTSAFQARKIL